MASYTTFLKGATARVEIRGVEELQRKFQALAMQGSSEDVLVRALIPTRDRMKELVHVLSGKTRDSIEIKVRPTRKGWAEASVGPSGERGARVGTFLEYGTSRAHAYPFIRPAWDATKDQITGLVGRELWPEIVERAK